MIPDVMVNAYPSSPSLNVSLQMSQTQHPARLEIKDCGDGRAMMILDQSLPWSEVIKLLLILTQKGPEPR